MSRTDISLDELKKALAWVEANTASESIGVVIGTCSVEIRSFDRESREVVITLFDKNNRSFPTIKRTERL